MCDHINKTYVGCYLQIILLKDAMLRLSKQPNTNITEKNEFVENVWPAYIYIWPCKCFEPLRYSEC